MMRQTPSPYLPQDPHDVPALTKMVNIGPDDTQAIKTEHPDVPSLVQTDANSNYQSHQPPHQSPHNSLPSTQSPHPGQPGQVLYLLLTIASII